MSFEEFGDIAVTREEGYVEWKIKDYFSQPKGVNEVWKSPTFRSSNGKWQIAVFPHFKIIPESEPSYTQVSIFLIKCEPQSSVCPVSCRLGIKESNGSIYVSAEAAPESETYIWGCWELVDDSKLLTDKNKVESEGVVTFFCRFSVPGRVVQDASQQTTVYSDFRTLSTDYKNLFLSGEKSDVTIKVRDKDFRVHSLVLATRSSVFASMFSHDMKEKSSGIVDVVDCSPEAFREFLVYVYCGETENISSENVSDMYYMAEKYDFQELKITCSDYVKRNLSVDNFCDFISLAIKHENTELIDYTTAFFLENAEKILVTIKWMSFAKEHFTQSNELMIKTVKHLSSQKS